MTGQAPPPAAAPSGPARRVGAAVAWVSALLIVAIAGAGLILSLDHAPTEEGRPELTARGHALVAPRLAVIDQDVEQLAASADAIAAAGRDTLTRLRALDVARTQEALAAGDTAAADVMGVRDRLVTAQVSLLDGTSLTGLPASDRIRIGTIDAALAAAGQLPGDWQQVALAASGPLELLQALDAHDTEVVNATDSGRAGKWADALMALDDAQRLLVPARAVRDAAHAAGADVSTLDDLLDRIDAYDQALTDLYTSLRASQGSTTAASRAALARVQAAQESLPADQTAMVVVISDLAGPTITPSLLSIETARGALGAALDALPRPTDMTPASTDMTPALTDSAPALTGSGSGSSGVVSS